MRAARRVGLPPAVAAIGAGLVLTAGLVAGLATGGREAELAQGAKAAVQSRFATLGFRLATVHLQGASKAAQGEIVRAAALKPQTPILAIDLGAVRRRVEAVGWVKRARVIRLLPSTLVIAVEQRSLVAVWQHDGRSRVITADGGGVDQADPGHFSGLPVVVGAGANTAAAAILPAVETRARLASRTAALVRVDQRRWDVALKDGGVILLPADDPAAALVRLDSLDKEDRILDLGLARIDLRDPQMVIVRPRSGAAPATQAGPTA
ncbi:MAG: cell division protein FtsQ/DivIB [Caulobacteraceae bacterium]